METAFYVLAAVTVAGAVAAMALPRLVHCTLCLAVAFVGLAGHFLLLGAEFVSFAQVLVYVGAVAILVVFAMLLTRSADAPPAWVVSRPGLLGVGVAVLVFGCLAATVAGSGLAGREAPPAPEVTVKALGERLMAEYVVPLEVVGLLLTAALIGAVILALEDRAKGGT
ncbi:MAG: NADH-quinone oxidoreductase subunit J [Verrucomicrobia bacterium]|nr:NADH-quinone oxidoreductase subunit J [Verrucomicrobiota bacterium]